MVNLVFTRGLRNFKRATRVQAPVIVLRNGFLYKVLRTVGRILRVTVLTALHFALFLRDWVSLVLWHIALSIRVLRYRVRWVYILQLGDVHVGCTCLDRD